MRVSRALLASPVVEEEAQMPVAVSGFPGPGFPGSVVQGVVESRLVEELQDEVRRVGSKIFLPCFCLTLLWDWHWHRQC